MKLLFFLTESINKKRLIKLLTSDMGYDESESKNILYDLVEKIKNLPDELILYRLLNVDNEKDINTNRLGSHYSDKKRDLLHSHYFVDGGGENYYLVTVKVNKSMIDIMSTLENNILYPHENEITLKEKGKGAQIISIKKINKY